MCMIVVGEFYCVFCGVDCCWVYVCFDCVYYYWWFLYECVDYYGFVWVVVVLGVVELF